MRLKDAVRFAPDVNFSSEPTAAWLLKEKEISSRSFEGLKPQTRTTVLGWCVISPTSPRKEASTRLWFVMADETPSADMENFAVRV
jgi:hypothetical protein